MADLEYVVDELDRTESFLSDAEISVESAESEIQRLIDWIEEREDTEDSDTEAQLRTLIDVQWDIRNLAGQVTDLRQEVDEALNALRDLG